MGKKVTNLQSMISVCEFEQIQQICWLNIALFSEWRVVTFRVAFSISIYYLYNPYDIKNRVQHCVIVPKCNFPLNKWVQNFIAPLSSHNLEP